MPQYTYRREDGSTFTVRQKFSDDPLTVDPETGQKVNRVMHAAGVIFKGSGFYINDSKGATSTSTPPKTENGSSSESKSESSDSTTESKSTSAETTTSKADTAAD